MSKISIVCDTTMDLTFEEAEALNIHLISNGLSVAGNDYREFIDMDTDSFLEIDSQSDIIPKTGAAAPGHTMEVMLEATKDSKDVLCLAMTSSYSGGINIRSMVAQQLNEDYDTNIVVYDTPSIFSGGVPYYREAARLRDLDKSLEEIVVGLDNFAKHSSAHYAAEPYYLTEGGRFSESMEDLDMTHGDGQFVGIYIDEDHGILWKARDASEAVESLLQDFDQAVQAAQADDIKLAVIITGNTKSQAETELINQLQERYPNLKTEHHRMGPIASIHVGHGAFGLVWFPDFEIKRLCV